MRLLALDTATEWCSVALWQDGDILEREARAERGHGGHVLLQVDALLAAAGVSLQALDAIAFGCGPGAFTGLRLAASITQGLAYAAGLPVIAVSDLRALAQQALETQARAAEVPPSAREPMRRRVLVCQDARMGEAYWAGFEDREGYACAVTGEAVAAPPPLVAAARLWLEAAEASGAPAWACGAGSAFEVYPTLRAGLASHLKVLIPDLHPRAREIARLAAYEGLGTAVAAACAQPVYVRNEVAIVPPRNAAALS